MARNYITEQCCSVQDLQSYLRCWHPTDPEAVKQALTNLQESIDYEKDHQNRVSIIKLLTSKRNAIAKHNGYEIVEKCQIQNLGMAKTVGDLLDKLNEIPFNADFCFRNQPQQTLHYDKEKALCFFQPTEDILDHVNFDLLQKKHGEWSDLTFGARSAKGPLHHLLKEVNEVIENPNDLEEYADCGLLLMDALRISGYTMNELYVAMCCKFEKNKTRIWRTPDENGTVEHVRV